MEQFLASTCGATIVRKRPRKRKSPTNNLRFRTVAFRRQCPGPEIRNYNSIALPGNPAQADGDPESRHFRRGVWHTPVFGFPLPPVETVSQSRNSHQCHSERQRRISRFLYLAKTRSFGYRLRMTLRHSLHSEELKSDDKFYR